jgi:ankyrin repeat protein
VPLLRWLLEQGASPNTKSTRQPGSCAQRLTPLAQAATLADPTALEVLLFYGAQDPMAIFHAIGLRGGQGNGTVTMKVLIQRGADVDYVSTRWATPLCQSVRIADEEKLKLLLDHGANPAIRSRGRSTNAYEYAVELGRTRFFDIMEATCGSSAP